MLWSPFLENMTRMNMQMHTLLANQSVKLLSQLYLHRIPLNSMLETTHKAIITLLVWLRQVELSVKCKGGGGEINPHDQPSP